MQATHKIRILSGEWAGRELQLPRDVIHIGANEESDLHVIIPEHKDAEIILKIDGQDVFLQSGKLPVWFQGARQQDRGELGYLLPHNKSVDVAGFVFVIALVDESIGITQPAPRIAARSRSQKITLYVLSGFAGVSALLGLILGFFELEYQPPQRVPLEVFIETELQKDIFKDLAVTQLESGIYQIHGHCEETRVLNQFLLQLRSRGAVYSNKAICRDQFIRQAHSALTLNGYDNVTVDAGKNPGTLLFIGEIVDSTRWALVTRSLEEIQGLVSWTVRNTSHEGVIHLMMLLKSDQLLQHLSLVQRSNLVIITGELSGEKEEELMQLIDVYQDTYKDDRIIYQNIPATDNLPGIFPALITSYGGNANNLFVELQNGQRIRTGTTLPSGYQVIQISRSGVRLQRKNELIHFPLDF